MPSSSNYVRDYKQEYATSKSRGEGKSRAKRNAARSKMQKEGKVRKGDGKDVDHKRGVSAGNGKGNLRVRSAASNRSAGGKKGSKKGKAAGGRKGSK